MADAPAAAKRQDVKKAGKKVVFSDKDDVKEATPRNDDKHAKKPKLKKFEKAAGAWNRHDLVRNVAKALVLLLFPIAYLQWSVVERQRVALTEWPAAEACHIHEAYTTEARVQKSLVTKTTEFRLKVKYSYRTPNNANLTSTNAFYYGSKQPAKSMKLTDRIVDHLHRHGCTALYNPADETEVFLLQEFHYEPYLWALGEATALFAFVWYVAMEHNFHMMPEPDARFEPAGDAPLTPKDFTLVGDEFLDPAAKPHWFHLAQLHGVRTWGEWAVGLAVCAAWHLWGRFVWSAYTGHPHYAAGAQDMFTLYHLVGLFLVLRLLYQALLSSRVRDVTLLIDTNQIVMGADFTVVVQIPRRASWIPVYFHDCRLKFSLTESTYGPGGGRRTSNRQTKILHSDELAFFEEMAIPKDAAGLVAVLPFNGHICRLAPSSSDGGRETAWHRWAFDLKVSLALLPFSYDEQWPIVCYVPHELRPRKDDSDSEEEDAADAKAAK